MTLSSFDVPAGARILCWFSCGAASACATRDTLFVFRKTHEVIPVYCDTSRNEHPDNERFIKDCEKWFEAPVMRLKSAKFDTVEEVFEKQRYMSGPKGAVCTGALKKTPRFDFAKPDDIHVFGFTANEKRRIKAFEQRNPELNLLWMLAESGTTKPACFKRLLKEGIALPRMYELGYRNNNCIGCVKSTSPGYWQKVRADFPEVFAQRAQQSREIGCRLLEIHKERKFLDELPFDVHFPYKGEAISCGPDCGGTK